MKSTIQKIFLTIAIIYCISNPVQSMATMNNAHKENVQAYIEELNILQNQIFSLAQKVVFEQEVNMSYVKDTVKNLNKYLDTLRGKIDSDLIKDSSIENSLYMNRDLLMLDNTINYMKSALSELSYLVNQTSGAEKIITLERYFNFKIYAGNTLKFTKNLIGE